MDSAKCYVGSQLVSMRLHLYMVTTELLVVSWFCPVALLRDGTHKQPKTSGLVIECTLASPTALALVSGHLTHGQQSNGSSHFALPSLLRVRLSYFVSQSCPGYWIEPFFVLTLTTCLPYGSVTCSRCQLNTLFNFGPFLLVYNTIVFGMKQT